jgi:hypothetical protein
MAKTCLHLGQELDHLLLNSPSQVGILHYTIEASFRLLFEDSQVPLRLFGAEGLEGT